jgi:hypothetical protein
MKKLEIIKEALKRFNPGVYNAAQLNTIAQNLWLYIKIFDDHTPSLLEVKGNDEEVITAWVDYFKKCNS